MRLATTLLTLALCTAPAAAQACSDLSVTGDGMPGTTLSFDVTGAPAGAATIVFVGFGGVAMMPAPVFGLELLPPFVPVGAGRADMNGDFGVDLTVPAMLMREITGDAQALSLTFTRPMGMPTMGLPFSFCTSDVEAFTAGSAPQ